MVATAASTLGSVTSSRKSPYSGPVAQDHSWSTASATGHTRWPQRSTGTPCSSAAGWYGTGWYSPPSPRASHRPTPSGMSSGIVVTTPDASVGAGGELGSVGSVVVPAGPPATRLAVAAGSISSTGVPSVQL